MKNLADSITIATMLTGLILVILYITLQMGMKSQCELDKDYLWSFDFSRCVKVGHENIK